MCHAKSCARIGREHLEQAGKKEEPHRWAGLGPAALGVPCPQQLHPRLPQWVCGSSALQGKDIYSPFWEEYPLCAILKFLAPSEAFPHADFQQMWC